MTLSSTVRRWRALVPVSGSALATAAALSLDAAPTTAADFVVSEEIVIDTGLREFEPSGFRTRLDLSVHEGRVVATWATSETFAKGGDGVVYLLDDLGRNDGIERRVSIDSQSYLIQATPIETGGWLVLEFNPLEGLRLSRSSELRYNPED